AAGNGSDIGHATPAAHGPLRRRRSDVASLADDGASHPGPSGPQRCGHQPTLAPPRQCAGADTSSARFRPCRRVIGSPAPSLIDFGSSPRPACIRRPFGRLPRSPDRRLAPRGAPPSTDVSGNLGSTNAGTPLILATRGTRATDDA